MIADITSVVCGMGIGLLGRKSQQRRSDFLLLGELIGVATAKKDGLMPMEQFFDRDVNPIEDYNTFTWNGIRKNN